MRIRKADPTVSDAIASTTDDRDGWRTSRPIGAARVGARLAIILSVAALAGCAGRDSILTGGPTTGQLKTSLSHLEFENQQLKKAVAKLERENRMTEDKLAQEQMENGELTARLDDARNLLRDGKEPETRLGSQRDDGESSARTVPTGQSSRKRRKPPFAVIPGPVEIMPPVGDDDSATDRRRSNRNPGASKRATDDNDLNRQSYRGTPARWLPVADSTGESATLFR